MYPTDTGPTHQSVIPYALTVLIVSALVWAAGLHSAHAELPLTPLTLEITAPRQTVMMNGEEVEIEVDIKLCRDNQAEGFLRVFDGDGTPVLALKPVGAQVVVPEGAVVADQAAIVYVPEDGPPAESPDDLTVGIFRPSATEEECELWVLVGSDVEGGRVEIDGVEITTTRGAVRGGRCRRECSRGDRQGRSANRGSFRWERGARV